MRYEASARPSRRASVIPCLTLAEEDQNAAAAQYLVCSYLVRACREAMYELALDEQSEPSVRRQAIQTLKVVHQDWVAAEKAIGGGSPVLRRSHACDRQPAEVNKTQEPKSHRTRQPTETAQRLLGSSVLRFLEFCLTPPKLR